jgi:hypothetical protein
MSRGIYQQSLYTKFEKNRASSFPNQFGCIFELGETLTMKILRTGKSTSMKLSALIPSYISFKQSKFCRSATFTFREIQSSSFLGKAL